MKRPIAAHEVYEGRPLAALFLGPDYLATVGEMELGNFYLTPKAAIAAGRRHIDFELKAERDAKAAAEVLARRGKKK